VGVTQDWNDGVMTFQPGLAENVAEGDRAYFDVLRDADAYIEANGLPLPLEPEAWELLPDPECLVNPILSLDLAAAGVTTILWATGFKLDFSWLKVNAFDEKGEPFHKRGISAQSGIYFGPAQSGKPCLVVYLRGVARREIRGRSHRAAERVQGLPEGTWLAPSAPKAEVDSGAGEVVQVIGQGQQRDLSHDFDDLAIAQTGFMGSGNLRIAQLTAAFGDLARQGGHRAQRTRACLADVLFTQAGLGAEKRMGGDAVVAPVDLGGGQRGHFAFGAAE
jgi:hypothetical protein